MVGMTTRFDLGRTGDAKLAIGSGDIKAATEFVVQLLRGELQNAEDGKSYSARENVEQSRLPTDISVNSPEGCECLSLYDKVCSSAFADWRAP